MNRRELSSTLAHLQRELALHESIFLIDHQTSLSVTIYKTPLKMVAILSSLHDSCDILQNAKNFPETVDFYNHTTSTYLTAWPESTLLKLGVGDGLCTFSTTYWTLLASTVMCFIKSFLGKTFSGAISCYFWDNSYVLSA